MIQGKVEICGVNTATLPRLSAADTRALLEQARSGDKSAREKLIAGNLSTQPFVLPPKTKSDDQQLHDPAHEGRRVRLHKYAGCALQDPAM